ncbi:hypothetical protein CDAR_570111 [Caerostris darwini]|uniref:Uncharacterized protein n=1 Tax=Caerostris darwini TaxID=1538125 RepID=A0AAV4RYG1_9ARAC|nr:hypothetical protein CDAR_570111 [Caerostris darwini]
MDKVQLFYNLIQQLLETNQKARIWHYFQRPAFLGRFFLRSNLFYAPLRIDSLDETNKRYPYRKGNGYHSESFNRGSIFWILVGGTFPRATVASAILCLWELLIPFNLDSQFLEIWENDIFQRSARGTHIFTELPDWTMGTKWKKWRRTKGALLQTIFTRLKKSENMNLLKEKES